MIDTKSIKIQYTTDPSDEALLLYQKSCKSSITRPLKTGINWCVITVNKEVCGVITLSQVSYGVYNCHISAKYPLLGKSLQYVLNTVKTSLKNSSYFTHLITFPDNSLAAKLAIRLGFKEINHSPLILFRGL
jgi:hypothetical protein